MRMGVDLGGTKIEGIVLDDRGQECWRERVSTPQAEGYEAIVGALVQLVLRAESDTQQALRVGVGTPGAISPATGLLKNSNTVALNGKPLDVDLSQALGREVRLRNDADCFALSEATDGAAQGAETVFGVIIGTGTGAGIVSRGQLLAGPNAIAGEWGHNPLPMPTEDERPGAACYCGRHGCIETWLSGPGMARDHALHVEDAPDSTPRDASAIAALAAQGDPAAEATLARYVDRFARAIASVMNILDPEVIVLGGGLSNIERLYTDVPARWSRYVFSDTVRTRLVRAQYGDSSGVRGAAWLWPA